jgi:hypothetical protein
MEYENRTAIIISNPEVIPQILKDAPPVFHIYLIGSYSYNDPRITVLNSFNNDLIAPAVVNDFLIRRLTNIICEDINLHNRILELVYACVITWINLAGVENRCRNFRYLQPQHSIKPLGNVFHGKPIIIVGSGPSLDKNINLLKNLYDKVIIIACGSAIEPLTLKGIIPHFLMLN